MRFIFLALGIASSMILLGCSQVPRIDVVPMLENNSLVFDIPRSGVNGILAFRVEDAPGSLLWAVTTSYEKSRKIIYGIVPPGNNMSAKQEFPPNSEPPASIRGKTVLVSIEYQYDSRATPLTTTFTKKLRIPD